LLSERLWKCALYFSSVLDLETHQLWVVNGHSLSGAYLAFESIEEREAIVAGNFAGKLFLFLLLASRSARELIDGFVEEDVPNSRNLVCACNVSISAPKLFGVAEDKPLQILVILSEQLSCLGNLPYL
jgi:hypothetical protein